jgi:hypothetical protein
MHGMQSTALCQVCEQEDEDTFHTFVRCPHGRDLWRAMAEVWNLPDERTLQPTGANWLFHFLDAILETQRAMTLIIFWRVWHAHNEITHAKPCPPIEGSRRFLESYLNTLLMVKLFPHADVAKGKMVIDQNQGFKRDGRRHDESKHDEQYQQEISWMPGQHHHLVFHQQF